MSIFQRSVICSFFRNCTHILTRTKGKRFEDMFLVKIASKGTSSELSETPIETSLCYFNNFNHPQRDQPISFRMKQVIGVMNISTDLTQRRLICGLRRDHSIKLINSLIKELNNCSLGGDVRVTSLAEICQFFRFSLEIDFNRARGCNYGIPRLGSS